MDVGITSQSLVAPRPPVVHSAPKAEAAAPERTQAEAERQAQAPGETKADSRDLAARVATAVEQVESRLREAGNNRVQFQVDSESGEIFVQVVDAETSEVLRTIPPEELLEARDRLEEMRGLLFDDEG